MLFGLAYASTFVRGTPVVRDGTVVAGKGHGTFLERPVPERE
jgi:hypothetical protein